MGNNSCSFCMSLCGVASIILWLYLGYDRDQLPGDAAFPA